MAISAKKTHLPTAHANGVRLEFDDFSGGLNTVRQGLNLQSNELADVLNYKYIKTPSGIGLQSREGLKKQSTGGAIGSAIKDIGPFVSTSGTASPVAVADSKLYTLSSGTFTQIGTNTLVSTRGRMTMFAGKLMLADGGYLKYYDGTSLSMSHDSGAEVLTSTEGTGSSTSLYSGAVTRAGQKFTTPSWGAGWTLPTLQAKFWLGKLGSPTGNMAAVIRNATTGSAVASSTARDVTALESAAQEETFYFSSEALSPGTAYYCALEYSGGDGSNCAQVYYTTDTGASGNYATYNGSWSDVAGDCYCRISPGLPPKPSMLEVRYNRLWTNDRTEGRLNWARYSNVNDPNDWSGTGAGYIICEEGTEITALKNFYNVLLVHLGGEGLKSIQRISGTTPDDFAMSLAKRGAAAINQDVAFNVGNDFVFLSDAGLMSLMAWDNYGDFEKAIISDQVRNHIVPNVAAARFGGISTTEQQYWQEYGDSDGTLLVYDTQYGIWTKYRFELGSSVTPTAFAEWNGDTYVGDSAGHLWKLDIKSPQYYDGASTDYTMTVKFAPSDFGTLLKKHIRKVRCLARSRFGASYNVKFYRDYNATALATVAMSTPPDPDLTVDEATFTVDDAIWSIDDLSSGLKYYSINFEAVVIQVGVEDVDLTNKPLILHRLSLEGAVLSRL